MAPIVCGTASQGGLDALRVETITRNECSISLLPAYQKKDFKWEFQISHQVFFFFFSFFLVSNKRAVNHKYIAFDESSKGSFVIDRKKELLEFIINLPVWPTSWPKEIFKTKIHGSFVLTLGQRLGTTWRFAQVKTVMTIAVLVMFSCDVPVIPFLKELRHCTDRCHFKGKGPCNKGHLSVSRSLIWWEKWWLGVDVMFV